MYQLYTKIFHILLTMKTGLFSKARQLAMFLNLFACMSAYAQSGADRAASARMHLREVQFGITEKQRAAAGIEADIARSDQRIADLEAQKGAKPKFGFLYDEQIKKETAERNRLQANLNKMNADLRELQRSYEGYQSELRSASSIQAREKRDRPSNGFSLEDALRGKASKRK